MRNATFDKRLTRTLWLALSVLSLTTVHHVYGAYAYATSWRLHAALVSGATAGVLAVAAMLIRRRAEDGIGATAFAVFAVVTFVVPVLLIGVFEGGYNHVLKNALYFSGAPAALLTRLFPPPAYELPNDLFFEISGVMQLIPGILTGRELYRLVRRGPTESPGHMVTPRDLETVRGERIRIPDVTKFVHLQFRRFAGCPVCDLHLHSFSQRSGEIAGAGVREVVVFHSTREELQPFTDALPFSVVADPDKRLYVEFGVESSAASLLDPRAWSSILRGMLRSLVLVLSRRQPLPSMNPRGGRFGLPADFLLAPDGNVVACHYGRHAADHWSVDQVVALAGKENDVQPLAAIQHG